MIRPWFLSSCSAFVTALFLLAGGCAETEPDSKPTPSPRENPPAATDITPGTTPPSPAPHGALPRFADRRPDSGIHFVHEATLTGEFIYPEVIGAGVALFDFDGDGDLDIYLVDGGRHFGTELGKPAPNRLFRNEGEWHFTDVTEQSHSGDLSYGMGAIAADFDNDGDLDLFLTNVGDNVLLENDGTGRFTDVTAHAGVAGNPGDFSLGAAFADLDGDGHLDLYVTNYVDWHYGIDPTCIAGSGVRDYCGPRMYRGSVDRLYRSRGDGTFEDITVSAGIDSATSRSMGVVASDFDADGDADLFVTCDGQANLLWLNKGDGLGFTEEAQLFGCAVNSDGLPEASMGVACVDLDGDGQEDLYATHLRSETHTFYRNRGGVFTDRTRQIGLARMSVPDTGFGLAFFDAENDGDLDLYIANGHVEFKPPAENPDLPYAQRNRLLIREGPTTWADRSTDAFPAMDDLAMSRAVAVGDLDGDGLPDLVVTNNRGHIQLLQNQMGQDLAWLGVRLVGREDNRDGIGAVVRLGTDSGPARTMRPHSGYLASNEPVVRFGLGTTDAKQTVIVRWPSGHTEQFDDLAPGQVHQLHQGQGTLLEDTP